MDEKISQAIEFLNKNGYIVSKVSKAQMAIAQHCLHNKDRCNFNLIGIKCMDLICVQELIKEQVLPYISENENEENN